MSRPTKNKEERKRALLRLKLFVGKLQRGLTLFSSPRMPDFSNADIEEELGHEERAVPDDVKEGQFAVFAVNCGEAKRFIIELEHLSNPAFLELLEQAKEEYGFSQKGALAVPCHPEELKRILRDRRQKRE